MEDIDSYKTYSKSKKHIAGEKRPINDHLTIKTFNTNIKFKL